VERLQLRWITLAAVPIPALVVGTWIASATGHLFVLTVLGGALVAVLPLGAAAAITHYHLYDIDRLLGRALTYLLLSTVVAASYVVVVVAVGGSLGSGAGRSQLSAVVATLAAVSVALPVRRRLQENLDRRFNRRQFDALQTIRRHVRDPELGTTVEQVLRHALDDPTLKVAYWIADRTRWVTNDGLPVPDDHSGYEVARRDGPVASISFDHERVEQGLVHAIVAEARPELENERLRAAIELQLVEVRDSRERIVAAQFAERHRIERNLHDGAQQRLLALAFQLRAAEMSGDSDRARSALDGAVDELQRAVADLRDLANGLHPAVLSDGGLVAALEDLAERCPITVRLTATDERFSPNTEATAWFIVCEAVANAVKHSHADTIDLDARRDDGHLILQIDDDGKGGADPTGQGLRGIADRADAVRGHLTVQDRPGGGTIVRAELPCES
jgi:signal transduction histidine kinase